jgi:hypothetical protein
MTDLDFTGPSVFSDRITTNRLMQASVLAAITATVANLLVYYLIPALFNFTLAFPLQGPGSEIEHLPAFMVIVATVLPTIGAAVLLALLYRFTTRPRRTFRLIAILFLLLSLLPPFSLPVAFSIQLTLAIMHITAGAVIIYMLTTWAPKRRK